MLKYKEQDWLQTHTMTFHMILDQFNKEMKDTHKEQERWPSVLNACNGTDLLKTLYCLCNFQDGGPTGLMESMPPTYGLALVVQLRYNEID